jgi:hypothetical protein
MTYSRCWHELYWLNTIQAHQIEHFLNLSHNLVELILSVPYPFAASKDKMFCNILPQRLVFESAEKVLGVVGGVLEL